MGWLTDITPDFLPSPKEVFNTFAKVPGSPEALLEGLRGGFSGDYSWNPYGGGVSVGDVAGGGTNLSQSDNDRKWGRAAGTIAATWGLGAAAGLGGGGSTAAGAGEASTAAGGYSSAPWAGESLKSSITGYGASSAPWAVGASEGGTAGASLLSGSMWDAASTAGTAYDMWNFNTPEGGYGPASPSGNSFFDSMLDWAKRRYGQMGFKDWAKVAAGLYSLNNARQYQKAARLPSASEMASQPGYQAGLDAVRRQQMATGYGRSGAADVAAAQYGQNFYEQFARQRQMEAAAKYGGGGAVLSGLGLLAGGFGG